MTVNQVRATDGTTLGFRSSGSGPGLVVVHGALESSGDYADLAAALAPVFSVHVLDRRGRGLSGLQPPDAGLALEVDDVRVVLEATRSQFVYGVSSGGVIALQAALDVSCVERVAAYEPALAVPGYDSPKDRAYVDQYEHAMARNEPAEALLAVLRGSRIGPLWLRMLPRLIAVRLVRQLVEEDGDTEGDEIPFGSLIATMHHDFLVAEQGSAQLDRLAGLTRGILLLGGSNSPRDLKAALSFLEQELPRSRRVELPRAGHTASSNRHQGGQPDVVAAELQRFFGTATG